MDGRKQRVLYLTQSYYLDFAVEQILFMSQAVDLDVIIEITPASYQATFINFENDDDLSGVYAFASLAKKIGIESLAPYFRYCRNVYFSIFNNKKSFSLATLFTAMKAYPTFRKVDFVHFDDISYRSLFYIPVLLRKNVILNIHDPVAHKGEESFKFRLSRKLFNLVKPKVVLYSTHSRQVYERNSSTKLITENKLLFYNSYKHITANSKEDSQLYSKGQKLISFIGRLSYYKGISVILKAADMILSTRCDVIFVIAGKSVPGFRLSEDEQKIILKHPNRIRYSDKYISPTELNTLILNSHCVVCPYLEATQSGVLMTAYGLGIPVIASNVGAFPEYISSTSCLVEPNDELNLTMRLNAVLNDESFKSNESFHMQELKKRNETFVEAFYNNVYN